MVKATQERTIARSCYSLSMDELVKLAFDSLKDWEDEELIDVEEVDGMIIITTEYDDGNNLPLR